MANHNPPALTLQPQLQENTFNSPRSSGLPIYIKLLTADMFQRRNHVPVNGRLMRLRGETMFITYLFIALFPLRCGMSFFKGLG